MRWGGLMPQTKKAKARKDAKDTVFAYKVTNKEGKSQYSHGNWDLPKNGEPGDWFEAHDSGPLVMCENGVHAWVDEETAKDQRTGYGHGMNQVYLIELEGALDRKDGGKICARRGRLVKHLWDDGEMVIDFADYVWQ